MMFTPKQNWVKLCAIQLGGALSLPVFMIGYFLGSHFDLEIAVLQLCLGNIVIVLLSLAYMRVIANYRVITVEMAGYLYGNAGVVFAGASMLISLLGWTVLQWQFMKNACLAAFYHQDHFLLRILEGSAAANHKTITLSLGFMMILSVASGMLFDLPTFYRHARSRQDGYISLTILWLMIVPLMEGLGVVLAKYQGVLLVIDRNRVVLLAFILITGILTNVLNIYSASMVMNRLFQTRQVKALVLILFVTLMLSAVTIGDHLPMMLELIGASAEAIFCMTMSYVLIHGLTLDQIDQPAKHRHQKIYFITMGFMFASLVFHLPYINDVLISIATVSAGLMFFYYGVLSNEKNTNIK